MGGMGDLSFFSKYRFPVEGNIYYSTCGCWETYRPSSVLKSFNSLIFYFFFNDLINQFWLKLEVQSSRGTQILITLLRNELEESQSTLPMLSTKLKTDITAILIVPVMQITSKFVLLSSLFFLIILQLFSFVN